MASAGFEMVGVDSARGQLAVARQHAQRQGLSVALRQASANDLPFAKDSFDFVYAINLFHHIDERERAQVLSEVLRVLKPGGMFFLHEMNSRNPWFRFYLSYLFPLVNCIDEGHERWIAPDELPSVQGATWARNPLYFTFLPDFLPAWLWSCLIPLERILEASPGLQRYSAHYMAVLRAKQRKDLALRIRARGRGKTFPKGDAKRRAGPEL